MRHRPSLSEAERLGWILAGLGAGLFAGVALAQFFGRVNRRRLASGARHWTRAAGATARAGRLAQAVRVTLHSDELLGTAGLEAIGAGPGIVELHGWVATRALRTRAARLAAAVPGIESLVNAILVHGEDDLAPRPDLAISDQTA